MVIPFGDPHSAVGRLTPHLHYSTGGSEFENSGGFSSVSAFSLLKRYRKCVTFIHATSRSVRSILQRCESALIGYQRVPACDIVERSGWMPDPIDLYCSRCGTTLTWSCHGCSCSPSSLVNRSGTLIRLSCYEAPVSDWVRSIKYHAWESMADELGRLLGRSILESGAFARSKRPILVPVPMPWPRRFRRGIDHASLLCRGVSKATGFRMYQPLRQIDGSPQSGATMSQRSRKRDPFRISLQGAMSRSRLKGRHAIVIDDVRTTGRTVGLVSRALRHLGVEVVGTGVLAVVDDRSSARKPGLVRASPLDRGRIQKEMGKTFHRGQMPQTGDDTRDHGG